MPLVQAKCTNCGGLLKVESDKDAAICPFCQTPYIVEKAINNFNISNQVSIKDSEVHIHGGLTVDEKFENAENFLTVHKDYSRAEEMFEELVRTSPNDYRGWWGVVRSKTKELSFYGMKVNEVDRLVSYANSSFKVCDDYTSSKIKSQWDLYKETYDEFIRLLNQKSKLRRESASGKEQASGGGGLIALGAFFILGALAGFALAIGEKDKTGHLIAPIFLLAFGIFIIVGTCRGNSAGTTKYTVASEELKEVEGRLKEIDPNGEMERAYYNPAGLIKLPQI